MARYLRIWKQLTRCAFLAYGSNAIDAATYFLGKLVRFGFFLLLIHSLFDHTDNLGGYDRHEAILFFLTFNLTDVLAQAFLRGIYQLQGDIRLGKFDYVISKPVDPLFYSLARLTDILDIIFLVPIVLLIVVTVYQLKAALTVAAVAVYLLLVLLGMAIVLSLHIVSGALTVWTMETENLIWLYRESMTIGRFPPEIYSDVIRFIYTYIMPVIIIIAFPVKGMLGRLAAGDILLAFAAAMIFLAGSVVLWRASLKRYSSASS
ncbi:MAG: ABC-2 family transporter protein [Deltaproteobacteria bacterium]|nr:ABC-2 family transporter protein [Deltaproteobacteria bacterium]